MILSELFRTDITKDLTKEISEMNLELSLEELLSVKDWFMQVKEKADLLTLEDEYVGHTYDNLTVIASKTNDDEIKAEINKTLVKR